MYSINIFELYNESQILKRIIATIIIIFFTNSYGQDVLPYNYSKSKILSSFEQKQISKFFKKDDKKFISVIFLSADCPISKKYINKLKRFYRAYEEKVSFYIYLSKNSSDYEKSVFSKEYSLDFKLSIDKKNKLAKFLGATVTPEVFLINRLNGKILYQGAIDNWFYSLGKKRKIITSNYFENAVNASLNNEIVVMPYAQPVGCYIE